MSLSTFKNSKLFTRNFVCPIFGQPKEISVHVLPTYQDVFRAILEERRRRGLQNNVDPNFKVIMEIVSSKVEEIYNKLMIPIVSRQRVQQMIQKYQNEYIKLKGIIKRLGTSAATDERIKNFKKNSLKLFDIAFCKCASFQKCKCQKNDKVPISERNFLIDQRGERKLAIGSVDRAKTEKLNEKIKSKNSTKSETTADRQSHAGPSHSNFKLSPSPEIIDISGSRDPDYVPSKSYGEKKTAEKKVSFEKTALVIQRYGVSDRAAAALTSSVLDDVGYTSNIGTKVIVDKSKVRREIVKVSTSLKRKRVESLSDDPLLGLYFDGRHDKTLLKEKKGSKIYYSADKEDHYSLVQEPGSKFFGHITPSSGHAKNITESIFSFISKEAPESLQSLQAVGCDGTVVNTGRHGGVIRLLEIKLKRPLQWFVCLLHFNELPLRHLFEKIDGATSGPKTHCGPIGKQLNECESLPVVNFVSISCNLPEVDANVLSTDQKYLFLICKAIDSGKCSVELANLKPGNLSHSRWLTKANRLLRLYISTENPTFELKLIVEFIIRVYAPSWFRIKINSSVNYGTKHLFEFIQSSRYLDDKYLKIIDPVITNNAFFAFPENILLCMLTDGDKNVRKLGLQRVVNAKKQAATDVSIRKFKIPTLNFSAKNYTDLIDWDESDICCPPVLSNFDANDFQSMLDTNNIPMDWKFSDFPCHTQAVERTVKLVTEASNKVYGKENRDSHILATLESRAKMPKFESKQDYK